MKARLLIIALLAVCLTGCSGNDNIQEVVETGSTNEVVESTPTPDSTENIIANTEVGFATDNAGGPGSVQYDSGIYTSNVTLGEPYKYTGIEYEQPSEVPESPEITAPPTEEVEDTEGNVSQPPTDESNTEENSVLSGLETQLASYYDINGDLILYTLGDETIDEARERIENEVASIKEQIASLSKNEDAKDTIESTEDELLAQNNVNIAEIKQIMDSILTNGCFSLIGVDSEETYNSSHLVSLTSAVKQIRGNLEYIEYCDTVINSNYSSSDEVYNIWGELKPKLIEIRSDMAEIKTGADWINSGIEDKLTFQSLASKFDRALQMAAQA